MGEALTGLKRSCMCCDVNESMIGQEVTVMGWVQRRRDLGQLIFIALRDKTGLVQIAIDGNTAEKDLFAKAETVRSEYVLAVKGLVAAREDGNINPNMKTGKIEIIAKELRILSESETTPFQIEDNITVKDDLRLKYRYLDLRRPSQLKNLVLRQTSWIKRAFWKLKLLFWANPHPKAQETISYLLAYTPAISMVCLSPRSCISSF